MKWSNDDAVHQEAIANFSNGWHRFVALSHNEIAPTFADAKAQAAQPFGQDRFHLAIVTNAVLHMLVVVDSSQGGILHHGVDVERISDPTEQIDDVGISDGIAKAKARESVDFAKGSQHNGARTRERMHEAIRKILARNVLDIRFIDNEHDIGRDIVDDILQLSLREIFARGIIRVGQEYQLDPAWPRAIIGLFDHARHIITHVELNRHRNGFAPVSVCGKRIHYEGWPGIQHRFIWPEETAHQIDDQFAGAVADGDVVFLDGKFFEMLNDPFDNQKALCVWVKMCLMQRITDRFYCNLRRAEAIFVGPEFGPH